MIALGMTESEIIDLSFKSHRIMRSEGTVFMGQDPVMALALPLDAAVEPDERSSVESGINS